MKSAGSTHCRIFACSGCGKLLKISVIIKRSDKVTYRTFFRKIRKCKEYSLSRSKLPFLVSVMQACLAINFRKLGTLNPTDLFDSGEFMSIYSQLPIPK
jgi:hypothetical protein